MRITRKNAKALKTGCKLFLTNEIEAPFRLTFAQTCPKSCCVEGDIGYKIRGLNDDSWGGWVVFDNYWEAWSWYQKQK